MVLRRDPHPPLLLSEESGTLERHIKDGTPGMAQSSLQSGNQRAAHTAKAAARLWGRQGANRLGLMLSFVVGTTSPTGGH